MRTAVRTVRRSLALALSVVVAAGVLVGVAAPQPVAAANAWDFQAGNIITDAIFFNSGTMDEASIQAFLESKVPNCRTGYTCLKSFREDTRTIPATPMCDAYQGEAAESAARIIRKVAQTCGINPQVILVMLQKEQGLVADTWPVARQYRSAMGAGCPDTAACDANYYGFFNQVQYGAYLLKRYTQPPGTGYGTWYSTRFDLSYPVGKTSFIQFNPNASCGGKNVYVANQATHALYVYTPYTPTDAALAAGYAPANNCSAYGNRNFFLYFSDWFGPPNFVVRGWIGDKYTAIGGAASVLGLAVENERALLNGAVQNFQRGAIYSSIAGAFVVRGWIGAKFIDMGANSGVLGWPLSDEEQLPGGAQQRFEGGTVFASDAGTFTVLTPLEAAYAASGGAAGILGYPIGETEVSDGGHVQLFQRGSLAGGPAGAFLLRGWIAEKYSALGGVGGALGWPLNNERTTPWGAVQGFERGTILVSAAGGFATSAVIAEAYEAQGGPTGPLGEPRADAVISDSGAVQEFAGGRLFGNASQAVTLRGWIGDRYQGIGADSGPLGWPMADEEILTGGARQQFTNGWIYSSRFGAFSVAGAVSQKFADTGANAGPLGFPLEQPRPLAAGTAQKFENGIVYSSPSGTWLSRGWIGDKYAVLGGTAGALGWPKGDESALPAGASQPFVNGTMYASSAGAFESRGWIGAKYQAIGAQASLLGYPISDERGLPGGVIQYHQGGAILSSSVGAYVVRGWIGQRFFALGGSGGRLGFPVGDEYGSGSDRMQDFTGGRIVVGANGSIVVTYR